MFSVTNREGFAEINVNIYIYIYTCNIPFYNIFGNNLNANIVFIKNTALSSVLNISTDLYQEIRISFDRIQPNMRLKTYLLLNLTEHLIC